MSKQVKINFKDDLMFFYGVDNGERTSDIMNVNIDELLEKILEYKNDIEVIKELEVDEEDSNG